MHAAALDALRDRIDVVDLLQIDQVAVVAPELVVTIAIVDLLLLKPEHRS